MHYIQKVFPPRRDNIPFAERKASLRGGNNVSLRRDDMLNRGDGIRGVLYYFCFAFLLDLLFLSLPAD